MFQFKFHNYVLNLKKAQIGYNVTYRSKKAQYHLGEINSQISFLETTKTMYTNKIK